MKEVGASSNSSLSCSGVRLKSSLSTASAAAGRFTLFELLRPSHDVGATSTHSNSSASNTAVDRNRRGMLTVVAEGKVYDKSEWLCAQLMVAQLRCRRQR